MAASALVDAGFLIALLSRRDRHHRWAAAQSPHLARPWKTCEAALSEAFYLLGAGGRASSAAPLFHASMMGWHLLSGCYEPRAQHSSTGRPRQPLTPTRVRGCFQES